MRQSSWSRQGNGGEGNPMLRWLSELSDKDGATVGPKIARLGTLRESGVEVPDGFAITAAAFQTFLAANGLTDIIDRDLAAADNVDNLAQLEATSGRIRKIVEAAPLESGLEAALREGCAFATARSCCRSPSVVLRRAKTRRVGEFRRTI
jgi:pyruvate,water dikinase